MHKYLGKIYKEEEADDEEEEEEIHEKATENQWKTSNEKRTPI